MASRLTKKQQTELTEKLMGVIQKNNALQLRLSADRSVNEMNVNQISGALNRIHGQAIGKEIATEITIPVKQLGSGDPAPDNIRPIVGYQIDGIGTVYGGELNIETGVLTVKYGSALLSEQTWTGPTTNIFRFTLNTMLYRGICYCTNYHGVVVNTWITLGEYEIASTNSQQVNLVRVKDLRFDDLDSFINSLSSAVFVYELLTPETYTLTLQQMLQLLDQL